MSFYGNYIAQISKLFNCRYGGGIIHIGISLFNSRYGEGIIHIGISGINYANFQPKENKTDVMISPIHLNGL